MCRMNSQNDPRTPNMSIIFYVCVCVCVRARIDDTCMHVCVCIEDIYTRQGTTTNTFAKKKREDGL